MSLAEPRGIFGKYKAKKIRAQEAKTGDRLLTPAASYYSKSDYYLLGEITEVNPWEESNFTTLTIKDSLNGKEIEQVRNQWETLYVERQQEPISEAKGAG